eukprot:COSAG06_NODE_4_length_41837_cov_204.557597_39_plen_167_part_00
MATGQTLCPNQEQGDAKAIFGANTGKKTHLLCHFILKMPSFYQDRLGTNIGKALKKRDWRFLTALAFLAPSLAMSEDQMLEVVIRPALGFANFTPAMWRGFSKWHQQTTMPEGNWVTTSPAGISMEALGSYAGGYSQGYGDAMVRRNASSASAACVSVCVSAATRD